MSNLDQLSWSCNILASRLRQILVIEQQQNKVITAAERATIVDVPSCYCSAELVVSGGGLVLEENLLSTANVLIIPPLRICRDGRRVPHVLHGSVGIVIVLLSPDANVFCTGTLLLENVELRYT